MFLLKCMYILFNNYGFAMILLLSRKPIGHLCLRLYLECVIQQFTSSVFCFGLYMFNAGICDHLIKHISVIYLQRYFHIIKKKVVLKAFHHYSCDLRTNFEPIIL